MLSGGMERRSASDGCRALDVPPACHSKGGDCAQSQGSVISGFFERCRDSSVDASCLSPVRKIGEGGFARVYECELRRPGQEPEIVAVKQLKPEALQSEKHVLEFLGETELLKNLNHPNIVKFKGVCEGRSFGGGRKSASGGDHTLSIVEEFVNLGSLKDLIKQQAQRRPAQLPRYAKRDGLLWMLEVARGLEYLHGLNATVVHRDIKPENILLHANPKTKQVTAKLADFGLSAIVKERETKRAQSFSDAGGSLSRVLSLPQSGNVGNLLRKVSNGIQHCSCNLIRNLSIIPQVLQPEPGRENRDRGFRRKTHRAGSLEMVHDLSGKTGSLMYMAPEVLLCKKYNEKVDVFSFGVVLYEVLMGCKVAYIILEGDKGSAFEQIQSYAENVAKGYRPPIPDHWPVPIVRLLEDCWKQRPKDRPRMSEVVERIEGMFEKSIFFEDEEVDTIPLCLVCCPIQ